MIVLVGGVVAVVAASIGLRIILRDEVPAAADPDPARATTAPAPTLAGESSSTTPSATRPEWGTRDRPRPLGSEVDLGNGWRVRVVSAEVGAAAAQQVAAADEFNEPAPSGRRYVVVSLAATFTGRADTAGESPFFGFDFSLVGSDRRAGELGSDEIQAPTPALDLQADLAQGATASGNVVLLAGADERDLVLRLAPSGRDDAEAWVALG